MKAQRPLLEISIPTFNRTEQLRHSIPNWCRQIASLDEGTVTLRVIDDTSTDPAVAEYLRAQATCWPFLTVETNRENLGLEWNVTRSIMTTSGIFGLVPGDDDVVVQGGLRILVEHLAALPDRTGMFIVEKRRVDHTGSTYIDDIPGSRPDEVIGGAISHYPSPTAFCERVGPLSGLGLTTTAVFRSEPCQSVDPERYLDLTVFPQVGIWLECMAHRELRFCGEPLVVQRTMPAELKLAEARGRREELHMNPDTKGTHYLGIPYAAKLQRLIDVQALTIRDIRMFPERLLTSHSLVEWVTGLSRLAVEEGLSFRAEVLADAARLFDVLKPQLGAEIRLMRTAA